MRFLLIFLFLSLFSSPGFSQSSPSESGYQCTGGDIFGNPFNGFGITAVGAANIACATLPQGFYDGSRCLYTPSTSQISANISCFVVAVCLTGNGYDPADSSGFCPDPPDPDDDCDPDDVVTNPNGCGGDGGDGGDGGSGGDGGDGGGDSDGDGDPDTSDGDDGICTDDFDDGVVQDDPDCDCVSNQGRELYFGPFNVTNAFVIPPKICGSDLCEQDSVQPLDCFDTPPAPNPNFVNCLYENSGVACNACNAPSCVTDSDCEDDETIDPDTGNCVLRTDFCERDEHTNGTTNGQPDGVPDNDGTFACENKGDDLVSTFSCSESPPVCDSSTDPIACAQLQQDFDFQCAGEIVQDYSCEEEFVCTLQNPAMCAIGQSLYIQNCLHTTAPEDIAAVEEYINPSDPLVQSIDSGEAFFGGNEEDGSLIEFEAIELDDNRYSLSGTVDRTMSLNLRTVNNQTIEMTEAYTLLESLGILVLLSSTFIAFQIVTRAHTA